MPGCRIYNAWGQVGLWSLVTDQKGWWMQSVSVTSERQCRHWVAENNRRHSPVFWAWAHGSLAQCSSEWQGFSLGLPEQEQTYYLVLASWHWGRWEADVVLLLPVTAGAHWKPDLPVGYTARQQKLILLWHLGIQSGVLSTSSVDALIRSYTAETQAAGPPNCGAGRQ